MTRITLLAAGSLLAACATSAPFGETTPNGFTPDEISRLLADPDRLAETTLPTVASDPALLTDGTQASDDPRLAAHVGETGAHDTYALTQPPAFAGLGGSERTVALTRDLMSHGWREQGREGFVHGPSGMQCPLGMVFGEGGPALELQSIDAYDAEGFDTSCNYVGTNFGGVFTLYASRWPDVTKEEHFSQAVALMPRAVPFGAAAEAPVITIETTQPGSMIEDEILTYAYTSPPMEGRVLLTTLLLAKTGDWHVKMRATHTPPEPFLQTLAAFVHVKTLIDVDKAQRETGPLVDAAPERPGTPIRIAVR